MNNLFTFNKSTPWWEFSSENISRLTFQLISWCLGRGMDYPLLHKALAFGQAMPVNAKQEGDFHCSIIQKCPYVLMQHCFPIIFRNIFLTVVLSVFQINIIYVKNIWKNMKTAKPSYVKPQLTLQSETRDVFTVIHTCQCNAESSMSISCKQNFFTASCYIYAVEW